MKTAWDLLDKNIKTDNKEIKLNSFFTKLFSAPYGFDFNTALLLLSAWVGFHNKEIRFSSNNREVTIKDVFDQINISTKPTSDIIHGLLFKETLSIIREDPDVIETEVKAILEKIQTNNKMSLSTAESYLAKLKDFLEKEQGYNNPIEAECQNAHDTLVMCLSDTTTYNTAVDSIKNDIHNLKDIISLKKIESRIQRLKYPQLIQTTHPDLAELQKDLDKTITTVVDRICMEPSRLGKLEDVGIVRNQISSTIKELSDRTHLVEKLEVALEALERKTDELRSNEDLKSIRTQLEMISENSGLQKLSNDLDYIQTKNFPENAKSLVDAKIEKLKRKIAELQNFADQSLDRYQSIDEKDLRSFKDLVLSKTNLYNGSTYEPKLKTIKDYVDLLDQFFTDLKIASMVDTTNLTLVQKGLDQIVEITGKYGEKISQTHLAKLIFLQNKFTNSSKALTESIERQMDDVESVLAVELDKHQAPLALKT